MATLKQTTSALCPSHQKHDSHTARPAHKLLSNTFNAEVLGHWEFVICIYDSFAKKEISYFHSKNAHIIIIVPT